MADRRRSLSYRIGASLAAAAGGLLTWMIWQLGLDAALLVSPPLSIAWMVIVMGFFVRIYALPARWNKRGRARSRIRSPGRAWPWIAVTAPAMAVLPLALWTVLLALGLGHEEAYPEQLETWLARPGGELAFVLLAVAVAPVLEEFGFRGWIQRPVERLLGARVAIPATALLFAIAHFQPDYLPVRLAGGLVLGHAVYATRSIWAGVALHVAWNAGALAFSAAFPDFDPTAKGWAWAGPAAGAALVSLVWCAWGVRRMQDAAAAGTGARGAARGRPVEQS
ncbi:type II CAAX endopeptidase family protein [Longimicrobium sp.]|uniref:CPBP family intramembrane glutamic endopeptidase n=1 Tax=Longimicrobium sp. TaxID=2029185 RepID=UPI002E380BEA|nr:type II CAAX endopeptidase family protein [Longimicrobium sp.]HEX6041281.1 type II CAAX endopeptidase family protein [Longimicrobium sp.]